jgi:methionyl-tRNA formyltransferase
MLKIIYAGTPEFAVPALDALVQTAHQVVAVYTQPDRPAGRGRKLHYSDVKQCALAHSLEVVQPQSFKAAQDIEKLQSFDADLMIVAAYGILLPRVILQAPRLGCINIHGSLLPRWRGAAPIQRAILAGDSETGITLMQMDEGLDTGDMLAKSSVEINDATTAAQLHDQLQQLGADLLLQNLDAIEQQTLKPEKQDDAQATYARKLSKQEARIDWNKPAAQLQREVRAFNPWPVSHSELGGKLVKIWSADFVADAVDVAAGEIIAHDRAGIQVRCGDGVLVIRELQFAGKKRSSAEQVLNARNLTGERFDPR